MSRKMYYNSQEDGCALGCLFALAFVAIMAVSFGVVWFTVWLVSSAFGFGWTGLQIFAITMVAWIVLGAVQARIRG